MFSKHFIIPLTIFSCFASQLLADDSPIYKNQVIEGFSEPSRFETRDDAHFSFYAYFNEFAATQDGNEIAYMGKTNDSFYPTYMNPEGDAVRFNNEYHPGFQVGVRFNLDIDKWVLGADYFWYRGENSKSRKATDYDYFIAPVFFSTFSKPLSQFNSKWYLALDIADIYLSRPFYSGRCLTIEPKLGLKLGSIRENFNLYGVLLSGTYPTQNASTSSKMFGIGPMAGTSSNFLLGKGFSFLGDIFGSLLYARYSENEANIVTSNGNEAYLNDSLFATMRPVIDASIGLEWKKLFGVGTSSFTWHKSFYMSVFASYNFSLYFSQNVSRSLISLGAGDGISPGNLYLQGLSLGLDFIF